MKKKIFIVVIVLLLIISVYIYYVYSLSSNNITSVSDIDSNIDIDNSDEDINWEDYDIYDIELNESITINDEGIYNLKGSINDGLITINTSGNIKLILDNITINNNGPAIYIMSANTTVISSKEGSINYLSDSSNYSDYEEDVRGVIYSNDDLVLEGSGTLDITSNMEDGIVCKDDLKINSGIYNIVSVDDGIRGKDSVYIKDGTFNIDTLGDGIKSTNENESDKGYVKIDNGIFNIKSLLDGIQAETKILINNGEFNIETGNGASNSSLNSSWGSWGVSTDNESAKGIKAGDNILLLDGVYNLNTSDDSIHSNNYIGISDGEYTINSGDDGIHADNTLIIDAGKIDINKSYEGLEAETITINNGEINITSSDDGINVAGGNDSSSMNRPGAGDRTNYSSSKLTINEGDIYIDAEGDGLDANGSIFVNGGYIVINGPTSGGNGAIDYDNEFNITSGTLIALGPNEMAQGISNSSTQYGVLINLSTTYSSNVTIEIEDNNGNEILSYNSSKSFSSILYSASNLKEEEYTLKINGDTYDTFSINTINQTIGSFNMNGPNNNLRERR